MSIELKVKSKHLSAEAKIIRFEETKLKKQFRSDIAHHIETGANGQYELWKNPAYNDYRSLNSHRKVDVRNENRATYLARAFLAVKPYKSVENKCNDVGSFLIYVYPRFLVMVTKYNKISGNKEWSAQKRKHVPTEKYLEEIKAWFGPDMNI